MPLTQAGEGLEHECRQKLQVENIDEGIWESSPEPTYQTFEIQKSGILGWLPKYQSSLHLHAQKLSQPMSKSAVIFLFLVFQVREGQTPACNVWDSSNLFFFQQRQRPHSSKPVISLDKWEPLMVWHLKMRICARPSCKNYVMHNPLLHNAKCMCIKLLTQQPPTSILMPAIPHMFTFCLSRIFMA